MPDRQQRLRLLLGDEGARAAPGVEVEALERPAGPDAVFRGEVPVHDPAVSWLIPHRHDAHALAYVYVGDLKPVRQREVAVVAAEARVRSLGRLAELVRVLEGPVADDELPEPVRTALDLLDDRSGGYRKVVGAEDDLLVVGLVGTGLEVEVEGAKGVVARHVGDKLVEVARIVEVVRVGDVAAALAVDAVADGEQRTLGRRGPGGLLPHGPEAADGGIRIPGTPVGTVGRVVGPLGGGSQILVGSREPRSGAVPHGHKLPVVALRVDVAHAAARVDVKGESGPPEDHARAFCRYPVDRQPRVEHECARGDNGHLRPRALRKVEVADVDAVEREVHAVLREPLEVVLRTELVWVAFRAVGLLEQVHRLVVLAVCPPRVAEDEALRHLGVQAVREDDVDAAFRCLHRGRKFRKMLGVHYANRIPCVSRAVEVLVAALEVVVAHLEPGGTLAGRAVDLLERPGAAAGRTRRGEVERAGRRRAVDGEIRVDAGAAGRVDPDRRAGHVRYRHDVGAAVVPLAFKGVDLARVAVSVDVELGRRVAAIRLAVVRVVECILVKRRVDRREVEAVGQVELLDWCRQVERRAVRVGVRDEPVQL